MTVSHSFRCSASPHDRSRASMAMLSAAILFGLAMTASAQPGGDAPTAPDPVDWARQYNSFETYWYQGLAELDRYQLDQARYGEVHSGEAVLIFVTEDFHRDLQVKWDHGDRADAVQVLKLNDYRRFYTGIYPYTLMTSVFSPVGDGVDSTLPLKISHSTQEWCGAAYSQLNLRDGEYQIELHSYFQSEADQSLELPEVLTEDGIWNQLRRDPQQLPLGELSMLPASHYFRFVHQPFRAHRALAHLETVDRSPYADQPAQLYSVEYPEIGRTLRIYFETEFPHRVLAWEEGQRGGRAGAEPSEMTTRAVLTHSIMLDYWTRNGVDDAGYRDLLGLTE